MSRPADHLRAVFQSLLPRIDAVFGFYVFNERTDRYVMNDVEIGGNICLVLIAIADHQLPVGGRIDLRGVAKCGPGKSIGRIRRCPGNCSCRNVRAPYTAAGTQREPAKWLPVAIDLCPYSRWWR